MPSHFLKKYLAELSDIAAAVSSAEFARLVAVLQTAYHRHSQVFIFGNGGSGSTASHFACDFNKGVSFGKDKRFRILCLNDNVPTMLAYANDVSYEDVFVEQLRNFLRPEDLVIGISGSGNSRNVLKAVEYAERVGAATFGICGYGGGRLKQVARQSLVVQSDDMQKVEDLHSIILHCAMQYFCREDAGVSDSGATIL